MIIHLHYHIGRFVRIELTYHSAWLQISEIAFDTRPLSANLSGAQVEDLFERLNFDQASDDASASGTRGYMMPEEKSNYSVQGNSINWPVKYSLIIGCLCALGKCVCSNLN